MVVGFIFSSGEIIAVSSEITILLILNRIAAMCIKYSKRFNTLPCGTFSRFCFTVVNNVHIIRVIDHGNYTYRFRLEILIIFKKITGQNFVFSNTFLIVLASLYTCSVVSCFLQKFNLCSGNFPIYVFLIMSSIL